MKRENLQKRGKRIVQGSSRLSLASRSRGKNAPSRKQSASSDIRPSRPQNETQFGKASYCPQGVPLIVGGIKRVCFLTGEIPLGDWI